MVAITLRNVPDPVHKELSARARNAGMSLEEYLRDLLSKAAAKPSMDDWLRKVTARVESSGVHMGADEIVQLIREGRE